MTTKTFRLSGHAMERQWHVLDASGRPLGRVASEAAQLLLGKHKPTYEPHLAMGDHVVVINAAEVDLTGDKRDKKTYYRHTGYPGGLRSRTFNEQMERDPRRVIERAVKGMLPHNARGRQLFRALKVYAGPDHPHEAQLKAGSGARALKRARAAAAPAPAAAPAGDVAPEGVTPDTAAEETATTAVAPETEASEVTASDTTTGEATLRLAAPLAEHSREELDAEAARLGLDVSDDQDDEAVADAIQQHYDANPAEE